MASPGELVALLADALGVPEPTITVHDRNLLMAGLRTKGGRGWSAANTTPRDAAHLITAALGSAQVKESVSSVERYSHTVPEPRRSSEKGLAPLNIRELGSLPVRHSFIDGLEALIAAAVAGSFGEHLPSPAGMPLIEVAALTPGTLGTLRVAGLKSGLTASVSYTLPIPSEKRAGRKAAGGSGAWEGEIRARLGGDLEQVRRISGRTIFRVADLLNRGKDDHD